jgi:hypothetical protein
MRNRATAYSGHLPDGPYPRSSSLTGDGLDSQLPSNESAVNRSAAANSPPDVTLSLGGKGELYLRLKNLTQSQQVLFFKQR